MEEWRENELPTPTKRPEHWVIEDHVWFEDRWMVASLCDV
jgi:hypothetical protein